MNILLNEKMEMSPNHVAIGDRIYYLKKDEHCSDRRSEKDKLYYSGCAYITDIILKETDVVLSLEGAVPVERVKGVMIAIFDEESQLTYKLKLEIGEFTYNFYNFMLNVMA